MCEQLNNSNVIKNISFDQGEILWNIMQLYNNGNPFDCDMTASQLKFYGNRKNSSFIIPEPRILFDVLPLNEKIQKITPFQKLPLNNEQIHSIVFDPPFVISPKTCKSAIENKKGVSITAKRFSSFYPVKELYYNYYWWIKECYRVLDNNGILVVKDQSNISGGYNHNSEEWVFMCAMKCGFYCIDKFILEAKARLISASKIKKQQHARKFTSVFHVFIKDEKKLNKFNYFNMLNDLENKNIEGMIFPVK